MTDSLPGAARATLDRLAVRPPWLALGAVAVLVPLLPPLPPVVRFAPFAVSAVVLGLPHGAVDHLVPGRMRGGVTPRSLLTVVGLYLLLMGLYLGWWFVAPAAAAVFFVALTWFHWGQGDVYALLAFADAAHLPTRADRALSLVVRGGLPMLVPLLAHPEAYRGIAVALVSLFDPAAAARLAPLFRPTTRLWLGAGFLGLSAFALALGAGRVLWPGTAGRDDPAAARRGWAVDALEVTLLWAYFWLVPPVLAVGLYFCLWHSLRHVARLALVDDAAAAALAAGNRTGALGRVARDAAPLTAVALAGIAALALVVPAAPGPGDREGLLALYLVGIAVLTLPHVVVVTWMDRRQGVW